jgi:hypothetical protein
MRPDILLPAIIVLMAFLLKLFVDRTASAADIFMSLLELPVDIAFLAISFVAGFTIANRTAASEGLTLFAVYVVVSVLVVVLWRRSRRAFTADKHLAAALLFVVNALVCVSGLVHAVRLLTH